MIPNEEKIAAIRIAWVEDDYEAADVGVSTLKADISFLLDQITALQNKVGWYQDRDFYSEGPPE